MRIALIVAAVASVGIAQTQPPQPAMEARHLLDARTYREKAWGAWYAVTSHELSLRPRLIDELRRAENLRERSRDSSAHAYIQALFDGLIQTPGPVASDVLLPFTDTWRAEVLILLAREPDPQTLETALLAMRARSLPDEGFVAVNDLLLRAAPKLAYEAALKEMRITHDFVVTDQEVGFCGGSTACSISNERFPAGFPPIALYHLWALMQEPGDVILFDDPIPVYYRRTVVPTNGEAEWRDCAFDPAADLRQRRINRFVAGVDSLSEVQAEELFSARTIIHWRDVGQAAAEMEKALDEQSGSLHNLFLHLQRRNLAQVSGMRLRIETTVDDVRHGARERLPPLASREIVVP